MQLCCTVPKFSEGKTQKQSQAVVSCIIWNDVHKGQIKMVVIVWEENKPFHHRLLQAEKNCKTKICDEIEINLATRKINLIWLESAVS